MAKDEESRQEREDAFWKDINKETDDTRAKRPKITPASLETQPNIILAGLGEAKTILAELEDSEGVDGMVNSLKLGAKFEKSGKEKPIDLIWAAAAYQRCETINDGIRAILSKQRDNGSAYRAFRSGLHKLINENWGESESIKEAEKRRDNPGLVLVERVNDLLYRSKADSNAVALFYELWITFVLFPKCLDGLDFRPGSPFGDDKPAMELKIVQGHVARPEVRQRIENAINRKAIALVGSGEGTGLMKSTFDQIQAVTPTLLEQSGVLREISDKASGEALKLADAQVLIDKFEKRHGRPPTQSNEDLAEIFLLGKEKDDNTADAGADSEVESAPKPTGKCFVAMAVYGSYDAPEVIVLRSWRDEFLMPNGAGQSIVRMYYLLGPFIAKALSKLPRTRRAVRIALDMLVRQICERRLYK